MFGNEVEYIIRRELFSLLTS